MTTDDSIELQYDENPHWSNYNLTRQFPVLNEGRFQNVSASDTGGIAELTSRPAGLLRAHVQKALDLRAAAKAQGDAADVWAMPIGASWSFNRLTGCPQLQLVCAGRQTDDEGNVFDRNGLIGMALVETADLHPDAVKDRAASPSRVAMTLAGTRLRQLLNWSEPQGLSIRTSGSQLGGSVAGLIATGTHGSRLGYGGVQNQIEGMLFVTGPSRSVWIERASRPLLNDAAAKSLDPQVDVEIIRDDATFEDVLIHLGCMGIVCAVAFSLEPLALYHVKREQKDIGLDWLEKASAGQFGDLAQSLGEADDPCFYELTLDPAGPNEQGLIRAFHTMYFKADGPAPSAGPLTLAHPADVFGHAIVHQALPQTTGEDADPAKALDQFDAIAYFGAKLFGQNQPFRDELRSWGQIHGGGISGGRPGGLCNGSFAIARENLPRALGRMFEGVRELKKHFVFTVRFVSHAAGTLAAARFGENAVIEIDGLSRYGYETLFAQVPGIDKYPVQAELALQLVRSSFDAQEQPLSYSMHWGKLGWSDDAAKVEADYGPATDPASPLSRWRATRARLVDPSCAELFVNAEALGWGLPG